jgi:O-antigen/teichoic acid export membrane protein
MVQHGRYRLFALLIGGTAGAEALGLVHLAFRLVDTVRDIASTAFWRLMLPMLAERQRDLAALQAAADRGALLSGLAVFPAAGAMLLALPVLVGVLLGPAWRPAAMAALPLLGLLVWLFLGFAGGIALVARGGARFAMVAQLVSALATILLVLVFVPRTPLAAVQVWCVAQLLPSPYLMRRTAAALGAGMLRQLRPGLPALGLAALATLVGLALPLGTTAPIAALAARLTVFALVYLGLVGLLLREPLYQAMRGGTAVVGAA